MNEKTLLFAIENYAIRIVVNDPYLISRPVGNFEVEKSKNGFALLKICNNARCD